MIYSIGLTGTIASGKSTAAAFFAKQNIPTLSADAFARARTLPNEPAFHAIVEHFGSSIQHPSGEINRRQLREIIIHDPMQRQWLESLLHPLIKQSIQQALRVATGYYCVVEIPLLTHREDYPDLKRILLIQAEKDIQMKRLMLRDHCSESDALTFLATQPINQHHLADDIIINNGHLDEFTTNLQTLHEQYLRLAQSTG